MTASDPIEQNEPARFQFSLRTMFAVQFACAVVFATFTRGPWGWAQVTVPLARVGFLLISEISFRGRRFAFLPRMTDGQWPRQNEMCYSTIAAVK